MTFILNLSIPVFYKTNLLDCITLKLSLFVMTEGCECV